MQDQIIRKKKATTILLCAYRLNAAVVHLDSVGKFISKFTSSYTSFKQLETSSSKNRTCSFPTYGSPLLLLNIHVINNFIPAPNIYMDIGLDDSIIPYFTEPFQFKTSSLTPSVYPFKRYIQ